MALCSPQNFFPRFISHQKKSHFFSVDKKEKSIWNLLFPKQTREIRHVFIEATAWVMVLANAKVFHGFLVTSTGQCCLNFLTRSSHQCFCQCHAFACFCIYGCINEKKIRDMYDIFNNRNKWYFIAVTNFDYCTTKSFIGSHPICKSLLTTSVHLAY